MDYRYDAIILGKRDLGETDRFYILYTQEEGKITALGKGTKRPNAKLSGNLEPVTYSQIFMAKNRGKGNITGAIGLNFFPNVKANFLALKSTFFVFGIFEKIISDQEGDPEIFQLLLGYLESLDKISAENVKENRFDILSLGFILKLLDNLGYRLEVERCASCGKKLSLGQNFFDAKSGGILCPDCSRGSLGAMRVSDGAIKLMRIFLKNDPKNFSKIDASERDVDYLRKIITEELNWISI